MILGFTEISNSKATNYEAVFTSLDDSKVLNYLKFVNLSDKSSQNILPITEVQNSGDFTVIKTGIVNGNFGNFNDNELNYAYYNILVRNSDLGFLGGEKVVGYNKENSYIELTTDKLYSTIQYTKLDEYFIKAFDSGITTAQFLQYINPNINIKNLHTQIEELLGIAPVGKTSNSGVFKGRYYCTIVRDDANEPNLTDAIAHAVLNKHFVNYIWNNTQDSFNEDCLNASDFVIFITNKDVEYSHKNHVKTSLGFYSCGKKILNSISEIQQKLDDCNTPDREEEVKQLSEEKQKEFKKSMKKSACSGPGADGACCGGGCGGSSTESEVKDSGCCGGSSSDSGCCKKEPVQEDSGCCGGSGSDSGCCKKEPVQEDSGCCGGSSSDSGCCKKEPVEPVKKACCGGKKKQQADSTDDKKEQEPVKKGCCGGKKKQPVAEEQKQPEQKETSDCCRGRSGDSCCKTAPAPIEDCCGGDCKK